MKARNLADELYSLMELWGDDAEIVVGNELAEANIIIVDFSKGMDNVAFHISTGETE